MVSTIVVRVFLCLVSGGKGPVILEHMNDAYAKPGASAAFECRVVGEPLPHISWYVHVLLTSICSWYCRSN